jgi:alkylation response protein AidB-like acyl-CoA dehydrogenase
MTLVVEVPPADVLTSHARSLRQWLATNAAALGAFRARNTTSIAAGVEHDRELLRGLHDAGWSRWGWPLELGGLGGPIALRAVLYDELAAADIEIPEAYVILETLGPLLVAYAPDLARVHLPRFLQGYELWGQCFSEPDAGSDLAHLRTCATPTGDGFVLAGQKVWTTLGQFAAYAAVLARTGGPESAHRGLTMIWVDLRSPGVTVRPIAAANGRDEFAEMYFDDVVVPATGLIGTVGGGWAAAMYLLQYERGMYAWQRQALLHRRLRQVVRHASGSPTPNATAQAALGRAIIAVAALRARSRQTVLRLSAGENPGPDISIDKVLLGQAEHATFDALRQLDWIAMASSAAPASVTQREEWFYSRASTIFGGAIDVQRDIVAERVMGLPRTGRG